MVRFHATSNGNIPFTAEEEAEADRMDAEWEALKTVRDAAAANAPILAELAILDLKRVRPLAEGDTVFLQSLNEQIARLRAQLVRV